MELKMDLEIKVEFADGNICPKTDINEFKKHVVGQVTEIANANDLQVCEINTPAPNGTLGIDQLFQLVIENFGDIAQISKNTVIILQSVNSLTQMFIKNIKDDKEKSPTISVEFGDDKIELPTSNKAIEAFKHKVVKDKTNVDAESNK